MKLWEKVKMSHLIYLLLLCISFQTIAFSALNSMVNITGNAYARVDADVRITDISLKTINNGISNYNEFNVNSITTGITLNSNDSSVVYSVEVSNYNFNSVGIYSINGLPEGLNYSISNYTVGNGSLIDGIGSTSFDLTINGFAGNYDFTLFFEFKNVYSVIYTGISNSSFPKSLMDGEDLNLTFSEPIPFNLVVYIDGIRSTNYNYENGILNVENIFGNVKVEYVEKVYFDNLYEVPEFYDGGYRDKVKTIRFVNYVNIPNDAVAVYDVSEGRKGTITAWIDKNLDMYIGADWKIYSPYMMERTFANMTSLEYIYFDNFDASRTNHYDATFENCTNLISLDMSTFDFSKVLQSYRVFSNCVNLEYVDLGGFNSSENIQAYEMFYGCTKLKSIDLSKMTISTTTNVNLFQMFKNSNSLEYIDIRNFDFTKVTGYYHMFYGVPSNSKITVKDQSQKDWILSKFPELTNIVIVS